MSLTTRCTSCGTVFRVVQDQMRVSAGWVRCGRCGAVFNAIESLVDVVGQATTAPPPAPVVPAATRRRVMQDLRRVAGQELGPAGPPTAAAGAAPSGPPVAVPAEGVAPAQAGTGAAAGDGASTSPWPADEPERDAASAADEAVTARRAETEEATEETTEEATAAAGAKRAPLTEDDTPTVTGDRSGTTDRSVPAADAAAAAASQAVPSTTPDDPGGVADGSPWFADADGAGDADAARAGSGTTRVARAEARTETETNNETDRPEDVNDATLEAPTPAVPDAAPRPEDAPTTVPAFLRRAERAARWRRPWVRALLALLAVAGAGGLAAQAALLRHDELAARWPAAAPALARLCDWAGCTIGAPRRLEDLAVLSSTLVRDGAPGRYRLGVTLRNRAPAVVRMPAFELTLSDDRGRLLVRRVLQAGDFGADRDRLEAGAELVLEAALLAGEEPVVGYTIEIFYP